MLQKNIPILRIFDVTKAKEFYIDWLGFTIEWEHQTASRESGVGKLGSQKVRKTGRQQVGKNEMHLRQNGKLNICLSQNKIENSTLRLPASAVKIL